MSGILWVSIRLYTRYEVIGWRLYRGLPAVSISQDRAPDAQWFGADPWLLREIRGVEAAAIIAALPEAVSSYPYSRRYRPWPGPNSNTFTAHVARRLPQLCLALPAIALGKDYLGKREWVARPALKWRLNISSPKSRSDES